MKRRPKMNENGVDPPKRYADLLNPMIKTQLPPGMGTGPGFRRDGSTLPGIPGSGLGPG